MERGTYRRSNNPHDGDDTQSNIFSILYRATPLVMNYETLCDGHSKRSLDITNRMVRLKTHRVDWKDITDIILYGASIENKITDYKSDFDFVEGRYNFRRRVSRRKYFAKGTRFGTKHCDRVLPYVVYAKGVLIYTVTLIQRISKIDGIYEVYIAKNTVSRDSLPVAHTMLTVRIRPHELVRILKGRVEINETINRRLHKGIFT